MAKPRWEYMVFRFHPAIAGGQPGWHGDNDQSMCEDSHFQTHLNTLGAQGWEVVALSGANLRVLILKREL